MKMQIDSRRKKHAERILQNLAAILIESDELQKKIAIAQQHLQLNDTYFFHHHELLTKFPDHIDDCAEDDLVDLYLDSCQFLSRLRKADTAFETANRHLHFYDYASCRIFDEAFQKAMGDL
jgi:hypothetical protein